MEEESHQAVMKEIFRSPFALYVIPLPLQDSVKYLLTVVEEIFTMLHVFFNYDVTVEDFSTVLLCTQKPAFYFAINFLVTSLRRFYATLGTTLFGRLIRLNI